MIIVNNKFLLKHAFIKILICFVLPVSPYVSFIHTKGSKVVPVRPLLVVEIIEQPTATIYQGLVTRYQGYSGTIESAQIVIFT